MLDSVALDATYFAVDRRCRNEATSFMVKGRHIFILAIKDGGGGAF